MPITNINLNNVQPDLGVDINAALNGANTPSVSNVFATVNDLPGGLPTGQIPSAHVTYETPATYNSGTFTTVTGSNLSITLTSASAKIMTILSWVSSNGGAGSSVTAELRIVINGVPDVIKFIDFVNGSNQIGSANYESPLLPAGTYNVHFEARKVSGTKDFIIDNFDLQAVGLQAPKGDTAVQSLADTLAIGNKTNELAIESNNAESKLKVFDAYAKLDYANGSVYAWLQANQFAAKLQFEGVVNVGNIGAVETHSFVEHDALIKLDAPSVTKNGVEVATQSDIDSALVGLLDDRGNYNASSNLFPTTGGSGTAGAVLKGDLWTISVAGVLAGENVNIGDVIRALVDTPGQTGSNWSVTENNIGYVPENNANKTDLMAGNTTSSIKFLSAKGVYDWATGLFTTAAQVASQITSALTTHLTQYGTKTYAVASGTNTYTATFTPVLTSLTTGCTLRVKFTNANTGAATFNADGLGAKALVTKNGVALATGNIAAGGTYIITYDGVTDQWTGNFDSIFGTTAGTVVQGNDSRLIRTFAPAKQNVTLTNTGNTTENYLVGFDLLGLLEANDILYFSAKVSGTSNVNNKTVRAYINATNDLSGTPTLIATYIFTTGVGGLGNFTRNLIFKNSLSSQEIFSVGTSLVTDDGQVSNTGYTSLSINFATQKYLVFSAQCNGSASDVITVNAIKSEIFR